MTRRSLFTVSAVGFLLASCSYEDAPVATSEVQINVSVPAWENSGTRATEKMLYPINLLLVPEGSDNIKKVITLTNENQFCISLDQAYDIYAVCGIPADKVPQTSLTEVMSVPDKAEGGKVDFAVGTTRVTRATGSASITAERKLSWLDLKVTNVLVSIARMALHVKSLHDRYTLASGWTSSSAGGGFTDIALAPDPEDASTYVCSLLLPTSAGSKVSYVVEATTTQGYTSYQTYTSSQPLSAGTCTELELDYAQFAVAEGGVGLEDWTTSPETGNLGTAFSFEAGDPYFSLPATVVYVGATQMVIWPHEPILATLDEIRSWGDLKTVNYTLLPELKGVRWTFPRSTSTPSNVTKLVEELGLEALSDQLVASGHDPIEEDATDVLAFYDAGTNQFSYYDFQSLTFVPMTEESPTRRFRVYPLGVISFIP